MFSGHSGIRLSSWLHFMQCTPWHVVLQQWKCLHSFDIILILFLVISSNIPPLSPSSFPSLAPCLPPHTFFFLAVLGMKPRSSWMVDKYPTTEPYPIFMVSVEQVTPQTSPLIFHCLLGCGSFDCPLNKLLPKHINLIGTCF